MTDERTDRLWINTIRTLSMDAVQQANSGQGVAASVATTMKKPNKPAATLAQRPPRRLTRESWK